MEVISTTNASSPMPETFKMQKLSIAYVRAIAAKAGANVSNPEDDFGIDISFGKMIERNGRYTDTGCIPLHAQVKASKNWEKREDVIVYDLEVKNYDDMVTSNHKCFLILMCLPQTIDEWLDQNEEHLQLRRCCYYWRPSDLMETTNTTTKRIFIPRSQIFTVNSLIGLMDEVQVKI